MFNERYNGEGFPDWLIPEGNPAPVPDCGFPTNYFVMPALTQAYDALFEDTMTDALGRTPSEAYAQVWTLVAQQFRDDRFVFGYDVFNEPYPGSDYAACFSTAGCPDQDTSELQPFQQAAVSAIRGVDSQTVVYYEPFLTFNGGADTSITDIGPDAAGGIGISFHVYCLGATPGLPVLPGAEPGCDALGDRLPMDNALEQSTLYGHTPLITEFGATDDLPTLRRVARIADEMMISWQHWAWFNEDVCCERENESLVRDPALPPSGDNLDGEKLDQIVIPYPRAVPGTPTSYGFDHDASRFELAFTTARVPGAPGAGAFGPGSVAEVDVPPRQYPDGYAVVDLSGGEVVSAPGDRLLKVAVRDGASDVSFAVVPPGDAPAPSPSPSAAPAPAPGGGTGATGGATGGTGTGGTTSTTAGGTTGTTGVLAATGAAEVGGLAGLLALGGGLALLRRPRRPVAGG